MDPIGHGSSVVLVPVVVVEDDVVGVPDVVVPNVVPPSVEVDDASDIHVAPPVVSVVDGEQAWMMIAETKK